MCCSPTPQAASEPVPGQRREPRATCLSSAAYRPTCAKWHPGACQQASTAQHTYIHGVDVSQKTSFNVRIAGKLIDCRVQPSIVYTHSTRGDLSVLPRYLDARKKTLVWTITDTHAKEKSHGHLHRLCEVAIPDERGDGIGWLEEKHPSRTVHLPVRWIEKFLDRLHHLGGGGRGTERKRGGGEKE